MTGLAPSSTQDPAAADNGQGSGGPGRRRPRLARMSRRTAALAAVVVLALAGAGVWRLGDDGPPPLTARDVDSAVQEGIDQAREEDRNAPPDATVAYQQILPSMVTITTRRAGAADAAASGLGAGFVVNASGAVMTALHVVEGDGSSAVVDRIVVRFADGTEANGQVVTRQPENDIAVLAVDRLPEIIVPAVLGGGVQVGDPVFPVGNPLGLRGTLTAGVVSATGRTVTTERGGTLADLIQFDAAVNPGNSGGPLLDRAGRVVGVVTGLANPTDESYFVGVGFAVPIATAGGGAGGPQK